MSSDYKWVTDSTGLTFTDDERFEITDIGGSFQLRENAAWNDPDASTEFWTVIGTFPVMADATAAADARYANEDLTIGTRVRVMTREGQPSGVVTGTFTDNTVTPPKPAVQVRFDGFTSAFGNHWAEQVEVISA